MDWTYRPSVSTDAGWMAELRAQVMRPDLERLDRYDDRRVRERFLASFEPRHTRVITCKGRDVGLVAVRPEGQARWIEHFYLQPTEQGRGIGGQILAEILSATDEHAVHRLNVLQGSPARRLYERHGFVVDQEDPVDVFMVRRRPVG